MKLKDLLLGKNLITGTIPNSLVLLPKLQWLDLADNSLTGTLPERLGELGDTIWAIELDRNSLTGTIPASTAQFTELEKFLVNGNKLEGPVPAVLFDMFAVRSFDTREASVYDFEGYGLKLYPQSGCPSENDFRTSVSAEIKTLNLGECVPKPVPSFKLYGVR